MIEELRVADPVKTRSVAFDDWAPVLRRAMTHREVLDTVRTYLAVWRPDQLSMLPDDLAAPAILDADDVMSRAVIASRAELLYRDQNFHPLLQEMAFTLAAAATRLRVVRS